MTFPPPSLHGSSDPPDPLPRLGPTPALELPRLNGTPGGLGSLNPGNPSDPLDPAWTPDVLDPLPGRPGAAGSLEPLLGPHADPVDGHDPADPLPVAVLPASYPA